MLFRLRMAITGTVDKLVDDVVKPQQISERLVALKVVSKNKNELNLIFWK